MGQLSRAKYQQLADALKSSILQGEYKTGTAIPSENKLQKVYAVSRHTVRQAIAQLVNEGYLRKEKGSGTYVSDNYLKRSYQTNHKTIGVITTYLSDYIFPSIIRGIEQELSAKGYTLLLASTNNDTDQEQKSLEMMLSNGVSGLIIEPTKSNQLNPNLNYYLMLNEKKIPYVMINACYEELQAPAVSVDDAKSGFKATEHLIELGHKQIGIITKIDDLQGKNRLKGYIAAHEKHHLVFENNFILTYETETKVQLVDQITILCKNKKNCPTAFVLYNDEIALQVIEILAGLGYRVPQDISIVSHDDSFLSTATAVKLTTVAHPKDMLGKAAAGWIIDRLESPEKNKKDIVFEPELVVRKSAIRLTEG